MIDFELKLARDTARLIATYGKSVVVTQPFIKDYDPTTGKVAESTPKLHRVKGTPPEPASERWGEAIVGQGMVEIYIETAKIPAKPDPSWSVTIDENKFTIERVDSIYSGENVLLYALLLKQ